MGATNRLSAADLNNLAIEAPDTPMHQAVLASIDAGGLLDANGHVDIDAVRAHVEARLEHVPELRRVVHCPPLLQGRPVWIYDPGFRIENHVLVATLPQPGGEDAAVAFAERELSRLLDRSRPLWQIWLLDEYAKERIGLLIKLHHAVADGPAMVNMLAQVFDVEPIAREEPHQTWMPAPRPDAGELLRDNVHRRTAGLMHLIQRLGHPVIAARSAVGGLSSMSEAVRQGRGAPRMSFNRPVGVSRRIAALHLRLGDVKAVAHREDVKLNDVFVYLVARGIGRVLTSRGETLEGLSLRVSVAVSGAGTGAVAASGNHAGTVVVSIPLDVDDARELLAAVAAATARAKSKQLPVITTGLMVFLARTGITRAYIRHQHLLNVLTTNLPGPPIPLYFAGGRIHSPIAIPPIAGNVTISFAALSYDAGLTVSVVADGAVWPDLLPLVTAMRASWTELCEAAPELAVVV